MTVRPFVPWPDRRLRTPCAAVGDVDDDVRAVWADMIDTMEAMPGVGLAACQIGVMRCLAVVDASETRGQAVRMADPAIVAASDTMRAHVEASPNLPGVSAEVLRPAEVTVRFLDADGAVATRDFAGLWATSVQHQIDHLAGRLYVHRLSRLKRDRLLARAARLARTA